MSQPILFLDGDFLNNIFGRGSNYNEARGLGILDALKTQVEDKLVSLIAGMAVTVEIKTGSRRVIEYLLSPLSRHREEAMRER